jgi:hypothetical protein
MIVLHLNVNKMWWFEKPPDKYRYRSESDVHLIKMAVPVLFTRFPL